MSKSESIIMFGAIILGAYAISKILESGGANASEESGGVNITLGKGKEKEELLKLEVQNIKKIAENLSKAQSEQNRAKVKFYTEALDRALKNKDVMRILQSEQQLFKQFYENVPASELIGLGVAVKTKGGDVVHPVTAAIVERAGLTKNITDITGVTSSGVPVKRTQYNAAYYDSYWGKG